MYTRLCVNTTLFLLIKVDTAATGHHWTREAHSTFKDISDMCVSLLNSHSSLDRHNIMLKGNQFSLYK